MGQGNGGRIAGTAAGMVLQADVNHTAQEGSGGQHHGAGIEAQAHLGHHAGGGFAFDDQVIGGLLENPQILLVFQHGANRRLVQHPIRLCPGRAHGRALAAVENPELDTGPIGGAGHGSAQGVDFLDQMALTDATDGRVTGHLSEGFDVVGQQQGFTPHACRRQRSLGAGMATTNHDHIKATGKIHDSPRLFCKKTIDPDDPHTIAYPMQANRLF